jgi:hypothetical protein
VYLLKKVFQLKAETNPSFPIIVFIGIAVLTTLASFLSLILPLGGLAAILILIGALSISFIFFPLKKFILPSYHYLILILFALAGLAILENSIQTPMDSDTALYHAQAIRWIETYRIVPGLANLHNRLAYNSSWLVLNASLSFAFLGLRSFHLTNGIVLITGMMYFGEGFQNLLNRRLAISDLLKVILFFLPLYFYSSNVSSPGTDLPATLLIWIIVILILEKTEKFGKDLDIYSLAVFILSIFAASVKLSTITLSILPVIVIIQQIINKQWRNIFILSAIGLTIILPWILRNIILSGYILFPLPQIDIFHFDWKYPLEAVTLTRDGILWFARFPNKNWREYVGLSPIQWIPLWFENLSFNQKILSGLAIISPIGLIGQTLTGMARKFTAGYAISFLVSYLGVIFWFLTAPDVRFGYGFLMLSIILGFLPFFLILPLFEKPGLTFGKQLLAMLAIMVQAYFLIVTSSLTTISHQLLLPADYNPSRTTLCPLEGITIYCGKETNQCNYNNFPCIPAIKPNVELRGASLQDGFRSDPIP